MMEVRHIILDKNFPGKRVSGLLVVSVIDHVGGHQLLTCNGTYVFGEDFGEDCFYNELLGKIDSDTLGVAGISLEARYILGENSEWEKRVKNHEQ